MILSEINKIISSINDITLQAGHRILELYGSSFDVSYKSDKSPVTQADEEANALIVSRLEKLTPDIPIISEEGSRRETTLIKLPIQAPSTNRIINKKYGCSFRIRKISPISNFLKPKALNWILENCA